MMIGLMIEEQSEQWHRSTLSTNNLINIITCEVPFLDTLILHGFGQQLCVMALALPTVETDPISRRGVGAIPQRRHQMLGISTQTYVSRSYPTTSVLKSCVGSYCLRSVTYVMIDCGKSLKGFKKYPISRRFN